MPTQIDWYSFWQKGKRRQLRRSSINEPPSERSLDGKTKGAPWRTMSARLKSHRNAPTKRLKFSKGAIGQIVESRSIQGGRAMEPTQWDRMLSGEPYDPLDPELVEARARARDLCETLNLSRERDADGRREILRQ